jgi:hypothetical protein
MSAHLAECAHVRMPLTPSACRCRSAQRIEVWFLPALTSQDAALANQGALDKAGGALDVAKIGAGSQDAKMVMPVRRY